MRRRRQTPLDEATELGQTLASRHQWVDVDDLEYDDDFTRLVELLGDAEQIDDDAFAEAALRGSKFLRAAAMVAIAEGREPPPDWIEGTETRFERGEWGERQLLLRALADVDEKILPAVLASAEEDWSGSPLAREISTLLEARVRKGEVLTTDDLDELSPRLQPLVRELIDGTDTETRAALTPALEQWQTETIDIDFFRTLGRIVDTEDRPPATLVGSRAAAVDAVTAALAASRPRSVLLVGEPGVGKTTLIVEALRRLGDEWFAFQAGAADVNAGQMYIGMLEARVLDIVSRLGRRRIAWIFPNFEESLWSGQHTQSPRGLLDGLLPHVEAGDAIVIGEVDPRAYELLLQHRPRLARLFEVVRLAPMVPQDAIEVARDWAGGHGLEVDDDTLAEALDLATHYLPTAAAPGNILRVLELVRDRIERGVAEAVDPETVIATLSDATGLPLHVLDPRAPLSLDLVREYFASRVLGQPEAVECLVDRIALVKAGLTDPTRPLGVFLFVGPTGTGKTEIAKAFSAFVFGSEDRLLRLDMSEYQTPESLERLLGDATRQEEAAPLIAQVRKQPFSVLLLDEFEKAHAQIWDVFLQVFDDGRLTDRSGRTVDLRHCVIILTSNLGSAIPRGPWRRLRRPRRQVRRLGRGQVGRPLVQAGVPQPPRPGRRLPAARARDHARAAREGADGRARAARLPDAAVGGRVGRGGSGLPDRAGLQRRARRAAAQAGGGAARAHPDRDRDRRAPVPRRRPVPLHHGAGGHRARRGVRRSGCGGPGRRRSVPDGELTLARVALDPEGSEVEAAFLRR